MIEVKTSVKGGKELAQAFRALDNALQEKVMLSAARNVAGQVRRDFKAATPVGPRGKDRSPASEKYGSAQENVMARRNRRQKRHQVAMRVFWGAAFWMRFREYGTSHQPPRPIFRPLWDGNLQTYLDRFTKALAMAMQREARKIAGTYGKARRSLGVK